MWGQGTKTQGNIYVIPGLENVEIAAASLQVNQGVFVSKNNQVYLWDTKHK